MRSILRAAGRTARVFLWIVKGLLLILALAVLVLWPISAEEFPVAYGSKFTVSPQHVDYFFGGIGCLHGRLTAWHQTSHYLAGGSLAEGHAQAARYGEEWTWKVQKHSYPDPWDETRQIWGPFRWNFNVVSDPEYVSRNRDFSLPCWLLAPLLALWPLVSITLLIRNRTRRRRRIAAGCCQRCGYDLRATPSPGGGLLGVCPECGTENEKAKGEDR